MKKMSLKNVFLAGTAMLVLSACSVTPTPMTSAEFAERAKLDQLAMFGNYKPLAAPLTLEDTISRVLEHNLDARARMMEEAMSMGQLELDRWDLLPKLTANAGYDARSKVNATRSSDSTDYTYSSERAHGSADLSMSWNVLDFGVGYYNAKQNADRVLIANERRRKVVNNLVKEAQSSYWRVAVAQLLKDRVRDGIVEAEEALDNLKRVGRAGLKNRVETLRMRKTLLESLRQLEAINQELSAAKASLAALINVPPSADIKVLVPNDNKLALPEFSMSIAEMEEKAFSNNPDIREKEYESRIAVAETRKALLGILPGISLNFSHNYDDDKHLDANRWQDFSLDITANIFKLISAPDRIAYSDASKDLVDAQRLAVRMAVLAQVHVAKSEFENTLKQFKRADELWTVEQELAAHSNYRARGNSETQINRVVTQTSAIAAELRRYQHYVQMQSAFANMKATIGLDSAPVKVQKAMKAKQSKEQQVVKTPAKTQPTPTVSKTESDPVVLALLKDFDSFLSREYKANNEN